MKKQRKREDGRTTEKDRKQVNMECNRIFKYHSFQWGLTFCCCSHLVYIVHYVATIIRVVAIFLLQIRYLHI
jgi:uncharacterized membrane protein